MYFHIESILFVLLSSSVSKNKYSNSLVDAVLIQYSNRQWHGCGFTPYEVIGNLDTTPIQYEGYYPLKLWVLSRHGLRYPGEETVYNMFNTLPPVQEQILREGPDNPCYSEMLKNWEPPAFLKTEEEKKISDLGKLGMIAMGRRFRMRFGNFLPSTLDDRTEVRFAKTLRTKDSAISFVTGLFGQNPPQDDSWYEVVPNTDKVLEFDSNCYMWRFELKKSKESEQMFKDYETGPEVHNAMQSVMSRCSLKTMNHDLLKSIYEVCCYELAWYDQSAWCNLLEENDLEVMEYSEDLITFYINGYGNPWNHKIACPLFKDMFEYLTSAQSTSVAKFTFSHSSILSKFLAHLGLYHSNPNEKLMAHNFDRSQNREWAVSKFGGFGMNFAFILYQTDGGEQAILVMLNERPVRIPGCPQTTDLCSVETFLNIFNESIYGCYHDEWCNNDNYRAEYEEYLLQKKLKRRKWNK